MWLPIKKETGFTSSFCNRCGSPVPNKINGTNYMWIPLGLLEQPFKPDLKLNFCIESKHDWVVLGMLIKTLHIYLS